MTTLSSAKTHNCFSYNANTNANDTSVRGQAILDALTSISFHHTKHAMGCIRYFGGIYYTYIVIGEAMDYGSTVIEIPYNRDHIYIWSCTTRTSSITLVKTIG